MSTLFDVVRFVLVTKCMSSLEYFWVAHDVVWSADLTPEEGQTYSALGSTHRQIPASVFVCLNI